MYTIDIENKEYLNRLSTISLDYSQQNLKEEWKTAYWKLYEASKELEGLINKVMGQTGSIGK